MSKKILIAAIGFLFFLQGHAQIKGCTDGHAINYDPDAEVNNGSCRYSPTHFSPGIYLDSLDNKVSHNTGLLYWNGAVWTHNDAGCKAEIYKIDTLSGKVIQTMTLKNAVNNDWEDIAQDSAYLYIGDFGNDEGNRKDLCVYKIAKKQVPPKGDASITTEIINFRYNDQQRYSFNPDHHNFDCEAMICYRDTLYLFSKDWEDESTKLYSLPVSPGSYDISPLTSFQVSGLITGADISSDGCEIVLVGYHDFQSFIFLLFDFKGHDFFSGNKRRIDFPDLLVTKTEGIAYTLDRNVLISTGRSSVPQRIYRVDTGIWTAPEPKETKDRVPDPFKTNTRHL